MGYDELDLQAIAYRVGAESGPNDSCPYDEYDLAAWWAEGRADWAAGRVGN